MTAPQLDYVHFYEGPVTFFRAPPAAPEDLEPGQVAVVGVPLDSWVLGRNGQRYGPRSIREMSLYLAGYYGLQVEPGYLSLATGDVVTVPSEPRIFDVGDAPIHQADVEAQIEAVADVVARLVRRGATPVLLGGDHFVPYPAVVGVVRGLAERGAESSIGYLHIDSHLDFWDEFRRMGRYHHGTVVRRISELPEVRNVVFWGLNGTHIVEPGQFEVMRDRGMTAYTVDTIRRRGIEETMEEAIELASRGADFLYVSCDIDVIDGAYAPGTHSIVVDGLASGEFLRAMGTLGRSGKVSAFDVCEVLPAHDAGGGRTSRLAALAILAVLGERFLEVRPAVAPEELRKVFVD